jgi:hypothetical protein
LIDHAGSVFVGDVAVGVVRQAEAVERRDDPLAVKLASVGLDYPASCLPELVEAATYNLMHVLRADAAMPPARLRAKRYFNSALLIIDEVGFRPLDRMEANLFFRLVSARYERGSIVLTSNKHVRDWPAIFAGDEILTTAILDRLLHHVHVLSIDGPSYRLRELDALLGASTEAAPSAPKPGGSHSKP